MPIAIRRASIQPTARYIFDTISLDPAKPIALTVRHAGESNAAYWNELFKEQATGQSGRARLTEATRQQGREDYADRFARHVVVGWENVVETVVEDGQPVSRPVPCTPAKVREFFDQLIKPGPENWHDVFDSFRAWCQDAENFRAPLDAGGLGKG